MLFQYADTTTKISQEYLLTYNLMEFTRLSNFLSYLLQKN